MSTYDTTLLTILTVLMSLFFLLGIAAMVMALKVLATVKAVVKRAEDVVDSVEAAADVLKDASGKMAVFKLLKNIFDLVQRKK
jgi:hypothetical protein